MSKESGKKSLVLALLLSVTLVGAVLFRQMAFELNPTLWTSSREKLITMDSGVEINGDDAKKALLRIGELIHGKIVPTCEVVPFGRNAWGRHDLCKRTYPKPCVTITYGVANEYSFELDVRELLGCRVFALDPTVNHKSELAKGVYFLKWGAPSDATKYEYLIAKGDYFSISPPLLGKMVSPKSYIPILKMDCEGCEFKLYEHIIEYDPDFLMRVDQFAVEVHLSKNLGMSTNEVALAWGRLLVMLERAGHMLQGVSMTHCASDDEETGTVDILTLTGYYRTGDGHCHNYLFARTK